MVHVAVTNHSSMDPDGFVAAVGAVQKQVSRDFSPLWHTTAKVFPENAPKAGHWQVAVVNTVEEAQALGYHTLTREGRPTGFVAVEPTVSDGMSVSSVLSHEVLEMLADPLCNRAAQDEQTGLFYAYEVADPVQDDVYLIDGVEMSNFCGPAWFQRGSWGKLDHLGQLTGPFDLASGGYISIWNQSGWDQRFGSEAARERTRGRELGPRETLRRR